jgi:mycothiol synthase
MKNFLPEQYRSRPATMADLKSTVEMFNADARQIVGVDKFILREIGNDWQTPGFNLDTDTRIVLSPDGDVVGYYEVWDLEPHVLINCWGRVHPEHNNLGLGTYLLEWAEMRANQAIPKAPNKARVGMICTTIILNQAAQNLFQAAGMEVVRNWLRMVIDLDSPPPKPQIPEGIEIRTLVVDRDEWQLSKAIIEAFKDHWGYIERPMEEEHERWMHMVRNNEDFDPSLCFLAWDGDQIAGASLCWPKSHDDADMGWVDELAVRRPWRQRGLGLGLLHHSFGVFYQREKLRVGLGVDAQNLTSALRLYEKAGMHSDPNRQYISYEKEIRSGVDLITQ